MSVLQAAQSFVALLALIVNLFFQILNSIIQLITNGGSTLFTISGAAMASITQQADILTANASTLTTQLGNTKLSDLLHITASFIHYSTDLMSQTCATLSPGIDGTNAFTDLTIDSTYFQTLSTTLSNLQS